MSIFIDTNITYGYTIIHDKWHNQSDNLISNSEKPIFWSNLVQKEYTNKIDDLFDDIDCFLSLTKNILKKNTADFPNYYTFENFIIKRTKKCDLDDFKKRKILEHFWYENTFYEGISQIIYQKFKNFSENFEDIYFDRDKNLNSLLNLHDCGLDNYLKYKTYAEKLLEWGVHSPDNKIITDAHDCGSFHDDLIFVSTDEALINILIDTTHHF